MNNIQEKVKDLIEVCDYESLIDFHSEPSKTLENYHFTDVTSQLMSDWLNMIVGVTAENGCAKALAGFRGVGKSHFLATFGALLNHPELRSRVSDSHVSTSAQHLLRQKYPLATIRRGTQSTLFEEIRQGVSEAFGLSPVDIPDNTNQLVSFIVEKQSDLPFVIIIDTAFERDSRVTRDDGVLLGDLAEAAKNHNIFIGIALDDDITNADGINSAITKSYSIDYLDQEHLNRIVDTHIFPKHRRTQAQISKAYHYFRSVIPGFRWSEQRFISLYPLHPSILEICPYIRLYSTHFALLGFASQAGMKILGRPANSLIALDEVFESVEHSLRKSPDLVEVFEIYDSIGEQVISKIPIMQRLQAKLILKALFILSLDGNGTTASEISATMMIYDEKDPQKAVDNVRELLETIVSVFPDEVQRKEFEGAHTRYSLKISSKDKLNDALDLAVNEISPEVVPGILSKIAMENYSDWNLLLDNNVENSLNWTDCQVKWRGTNRRCRIYWNWGNERIVSQGSLDSSEFIDLEFSINNPAPNTPVQQTESTFPKAVWKTDELTPDELNTILRYYVLLHNDQLREEYHEQIRATGHAHKSAIENIWERIFLKNGKIEFAGVDYEIKYNQSKNTTLGELLTPNLEKIFDSIFPEHPYFEKDLGMNEVSKLVNDLFSGARKTHEGVQELARTFALPLGLVAKHGDDYVLESEDAIFLLPLVEKILYLVSQNENSTVSLKMIYKSLREKPFGLIREAQHLILAALVAQRKIEFVTSNGDRINRRSLDLKIIWDDIAGIAKPANVIYGSKKLTKWAKIITNLEDVNTIDVAQDRQAVKEELEKWLKNWDEAKVLDNFKELPDEILNTQIWYRSVNIEKAFGSVANSLRAFFEKSISLEVSLQRIADAFSDSTEEYLARQDDLVTFISFINSAEDRLDIWNYLAICEKTEDANIESKRNLILELIEKSAHSPSAQTNRELNQIWNEFHELYSEYFSYRHDMVMKSHYLQEKFDVIMKSDQWWEFQNLSKLPIFNQKHWKKSQRLIKHFGELDCNFDVREMLKTNPFCACSFNLTQMQDWEDLPNSLVTTIENGRTSYRRTLGILNKPLIQLLQNYIHGEEDQVFINSSQELIEIFGNNKEVNLFSTNQLTVLHNVLTTMVSTPTVNINYPQYNSFVNSEDLRENLNAWIDELPTEPVYLEL
jgi:hypothetical protein